MYEGLGLGCTHTGGAMQRLSNAPYTRGEEEQEEQEQDQEQEQEQAHGQCC